MRHHLLSALLSPPMVVVQWLVRAVAGISVPAAVAAMCVVALLLPGCAHVTQSDGAGLGGTSWRLLKFVGGDDTVLTPDDRTKYTIAFAADGTLNVRFDCNRGRGTWKSDEPTQLQFGPLALTRAACPPGSLHDQIVRQWPYVRSYVIRDGHLFLSLMADGGIYELEPAANGGEGNREVP